MKARVRTAAICLAAALVLGLLPPGTAYADDQQTGEEITQGDLADQTGNNEATSGDSADRQGEEPSGSSDPDPDPDPAQVTGPDSDPSPDPSPDTGTAPASDANISSDPGTSTGTDPAQGEKQGTEESGLLVQGPFVDQQETEGPVLAVPELGQEVPTDPVIQEIEEQAAEENELSLDALPVDLDGLTAWLEEHPEQLSAFYAGDEAVAATLAETLGAGEEEILTCAALLEEQNDVLVQALAEGVDVIDTLSLCDADQAAEMLGVDQVAIHLFSFKLGYVSGLLGQAMNEAHDQGKLDTWRGDMEGLLGEDEALAQAAEGYDAEPAVLEALLRSMGLGTVQLQGSYTLTLTNVELEVPEGVNDSFTYNIYIWKPNASSSPAGYYSGIYFSYLRCAYWESYSMGLPYYGYYNYYGYGQVVLSAGESVTLTGLPAGGYFILASASANYYVKSLTSTYGTVDQQLGTVYVEGVSGDNEVVCVNDYAPNSLRLGEEVISSDPESVDDVFTFKIYLYSHGANEDTPLLQDGAAEVEISTDGTDGAEAPDLGDTLHFGLESTTLPGLSVSGTYNVATVKLKHGQSIVLKHLGSSYGCYVYQEPDTHYMLYQLRSRHVYAAGVEDFTGSYDGRYNYINSCNVSSSLGFVNAQETLSITKTVVNSDTTRDFVFNIYFLQYSPDTGIYTPMAPASYPLTYTDPTGDEPETVAVGQGEAGTLTTGFQDANGSSYTVSWASAQVKVRAGQTVTIGKLPAGIAYFIEEVPVTNYTLTSATTTAVEGVVNDNKNVYTLLSTTDEAASFTNTYAPPAGQDLTIGKTVTGSMGDTSRAFSFDLTLTGQDGAPLGDLDLMACLPDQQETIYTTDDQGRVTLSLKHGQQITLEDLPQGTRYTLAETDASGYTTSFAVSGGSADTPVGQTLAGALDGASDVQVQVTNDLDVVVPAGIRTEWAPFALLLAAGGPSLLLAARGPRRKDDPS